MASTRNGSSLSPAARLDRNRRIAEARDVEKLTWPEIARRFGLSPRHARRAYGDFLQGVEAGEIEDVDVDGAIARVIRIHLASLTRLEELIEGAGDSNSGVGLLRTGAAVGLSLLDALGRVGLLPDERDAVLRRRVEAGERELARVFVEAARECGISDEAFERAVGPDPRERALAAGRMAA
jgi:hypothetical protein